jgi:hypothetical protein
VVGVCAGKLRTSRLVAESVDDETARRLESLDDFAERLDDVDVEELRGRILHDLGLLRDVDGALDAVGRYDSLLDRGRPEQGDELGGFETWREGSELCENEEGR